MSDKSKRKRQQHKSKRIEETLASYRYRACLRCHYETLYNTRKTIKCIRCGSNIPR